MNCVQYRIVASSLLVKYASFSKRLIFMNDAKTAPILLVDILRGLALEIQECLTTQGYVELASQVSQLLFVERCTCRDQFCASFYTRHAGGGHEKTIQLAPNRGMINLDICEGQIVYVEILYCDDLRLKLDELFPLPQ